MTICGHYRAPQAIPAGLPVCEACEAEIEALKSEASSHGDSDFVALCDKALNGDTEAFQEIMP